MFALYTLRKGSVLRGGGGGGGWGRGHLLGIGEGRVMIFKRVGT